MHARTGFANMYSLVFIRAIWLSASWQKKGHPGHIVVDFSFEGKLLILIFSAVKVVGALCRIAKQEWLSLTVKAITHCE